MKTDITQVLVEEHRLITRMLTLLERNAPRTATGSYCNWQFYLDGVDFIRNYADRFHHAKEEDVLFTALIANGMPSENSPVAAMLMEHNLGRNYVCEMTGAVLAAQAGKNDNLQTIADSALGYAALLREHISKEDTVLYPLAERLLPETVRPVIQAGYRSAEAGTVPGFSDKYRRMVEQYEQE